MSKEWPDTVQSPSVECRRKRDEANTLLVPHATAGGLLSRCLRGGGARRRARAASASWARALALMAPPILLVRVALAVLATPLTVSSRLALWISCCVTRTRRRARASRCGRLRLRPIDWFRFWNNSASRTRDRCRCRCTARSGRGYCFCFGFLHSHIRNRNAELERMKTWLCIYIKRKSDDRRSTCSSSLCERTMRYWRRMASPSPSLLSSESESAAAFVGAEAAGDRGVAGGDAFSENDCESDVRWVRELWDRRIIRRRICSSS